MHDGRESPDDNLARAIAGIRDAAATRRATGVPAGAVPLPLLLPERKQRTLRARRSGAGSDDERAGATLQPNSASRWSRACSKQRAPGLYHNTAAVLDAGAGYLGKYRKMHIPDDPRYYEKFYFTPGDLGFKAFPTRVGNVGVLVCWDQWYPEAARLTALAGAEMLFYPTAIGWHPEGTRRGERAQHDAWETAQRAHAIANGCYVVAVNRTGFEPDPTGRGGIRFWGQSFVAAPDGRIVVRASSRSRRSDRLRNRPRVDRQAASRLAVLPRSPHRRVFGAHAPLHRLELLLLLLRLRVFREVAIQRVRERLSLDVAERRRAARDRLRCRAGSPSDRASPAARGCSPRYRTHRAD